MNHLTHPDVLITFENYPQHIRPKLEFLRKLIIEEANSLDTITDLEETLKWGEPSFLTKKGSTIRIDYKEKNPDQYAMYFKCTSKLIPTFKIVFGKIFSYEKNRAILFKLNDEIPTKELKVCIRIALTYHQVKHLPNLGIDLS